jgi:RNA polymerase sigma factor (sigma-70 family)
MSMQDSKGQNLQTNADGRFATTRWSVVLAAGDSAAPKHEQALNTLCRTYWFPLYAYLRRKGHDASAAADHTQAFFAQLLDKKYLSQVQPEPGKFRSFMLIALKRFVANQYKHARAQKRGGDRKILSLDYDQAENRYALEPATDLSPEKLFEKSWALTVLTRTMERLETELAEKNRQKLFEHLKAYVIAEPGDVAYHDLTDRLDMTEGAIRVAVHRLRKRCKEILRDEVAQTVATPEEIEEEISSLFTALQG